jgi:hypothetical protein
MRLGLAPAAPLTRVDFAAFLLVFLLGQAVDVASTVVITAGGGVETNPVMAALIGSSYAAFVTGKLALAVGAVCGAYLLYRRSPITFFAAVVILLAATYTGAFANVLTIGYHFGLTL